MAQAIRCLRPRDAVHFKAVLPLRFTHGFPRGVTVLPVPRRRDPVLIQQILQFFDFRPCGPWQNCSVRIICFFFCLSADFAAALPFSCRMICGFRENLPLTPAVRQHIGIHRLCGTAVIAYFCSLPVGGAGGFFNHLQIMPVMRMPAGRTARISLRGLGRSDCTLLSEFVWSVISSVICVICLR